VRIYVGSMRIRVGSVEIHGGRQEFIFVAVDLQFWQMKMCFDKFAKEIL